MENLAEKIERKRVYLEDKVWYKEPLYWDPEKQVYKEVPKEGYLLASYLLGGKVMFIVSYGEINSCVVRQVNEVFDSELSCYESIIKGKQNA